MRFDENRKTRHVKAFSEWWRLRSHKAFFQDQRDVDQAQSPSTSSSNSFRKTLAFDDTLSASFCMSNFNEMQLDCTQLHKNFQTGSDITGLVSTSALNSRQFTYSHSLEKLELQEDISSDYSHLNDYIHCQRFASKIFPRIIPSASRLRFCKKHCNAIINTCGNCKPSKLAHKLRRISVDARKESALTSDGVKSRNIALRRRQRSRHGCWLTFYNRTILMIIFCVATILFGQAIAQLQTTTFTKPNGQRASTNPTIPTALTSKSKIINPLVPSILKNNNDFTKVTIKSLSNPTVVIKEVTESTTIKPKIVVESATENAQLTESNTIVTQLLSTQAKQFVEPAKDLEWKTSSKITPTPTAAKVEQQNPTKSKTPNGITYSTRSISFDQRNRTLVNDNVAMKTPSEMVVKPIAENHLSVKQEETPKFQTSTLASKITKKAHFFSTVRVPLWSKDSTQNFFFRDAYSSIYLVKISEDSWNSYEKFKEETCRENEEEPIGGKVLNNTDSGYFSWEENVFHQELRKIILPETRNNRLTPLIGSPSLTNLDARFFMSAPKSLCRAQKFAMDEEELKKLERQHFEDYLINKVFDRDIWMRGRGGGKTRKKSSPRNGGNGKPGEKVDVNYSSINMDLRRKFLIVP